MMNDTCGVRAATCELQQYFCFEVLVVTMRMEHPTTSSAVLLCWSTAQIAIQEYTHTLLPRASAPVQWPHPPPQTAQQSLQRKT
eukprot:21145-Heterococcus_DN1.PRE.1